MGFSKRMTKKSKKWRNALIYLALFGVAPTAFGAETRYASTFDELASAITEYNGNKGVDYVIALTSSISLTDNLPQITGNTDLKGVKNGTLTIVGNGWTIDGVGTYSGLYVDAGKSGATITVSNANFANCAAQGGAGGNGASGGGGGLGGGAAIYAYSGDVVLRDVTAHSNASIGGAGGTILQGSSSYGGGGGLHGAGGSGVVGEEGAADGGGLYLDGANSTPDRVAGDGGATSPTEPGSYAHYVDKTTPVGGDSLAGGGGGGSTAIGGAGGFGGGGGGGGTQGGEGGFGGGGGGGATELTAGLGGFGAGSGGYVETVTSEQFSDTQGGGVGGGGAALGGAIFVGSEANVTIEVSDSSSSEIYDNTVVGGKGGGGTAEDGEAIGTGIFLLNDLTIQVAEGGKYTISDSIGGYAGSESVAADEDGNYANMSGVVKTGEGTLVLNGTDSTYAGDTTVKGGKLVASGVGAISAYSNLNVDDGSVALEADQSVKNLSGGANAVVDLNSQTLTTTGDNSTLYAGKLKGDGLLLKDGVGTLALSGDSREEGTFNTELRSGTIRVLNDGALGTGDVIYTRTNENDQTAALDFAEGSTLSNDVYLYQNSEPLILSGGSTTLAGRVSATESSASEIELRLNAGSTLSLTNTGVSKDETGAASDAGLANNVGTYRLRTGNLAANVDSFTVKNGDETTRYWQSAIGNSTIENIGDSSLTFVLDTDDPSEGMQFANKMVLESGWLTLNPTTVVGSTARAQDINYVGNTSGAGGLRIDVGAGSTLHATGSLQHAYTDVASGVLDVSNTADGYANLGGLSSSGAGAVNVGAQNLKVSFDGDSLTYDGAILAEGAGTSIFKYGTGDWTLNLTNDSNVASVRVVEGTFSLGENHFDSGLYPSNDFVVDVWSQGAFKLDTTNGASLELNHLIAATPGGKLIVGEKDELTLTSKNEYTTLAANLSGSGWIYLDNVVDENSNVTPWTLSGDNSNWSGTIAAYDVNSAVTLASPNAGSSASSLKFGARGTLNATATTALGSLDFDNNLSINVSPNQTLVLNALSSSSQWLDDSVLTIGGGGTLALNEGAGSAYYGATLVKDGSELVLAGNNVAASEYGASRRALTLTDGSTLSMDYSGQQADGLWTSLWGGKLNIDGAGGILVYDKERAVSSSDGSNSSFIGKVDINDDIAFTGENANALTFEVTNAKSVVTLHSAIEGVGALVKTGAGTLVLDGVGEFSSATVSTGVLQLGSTGTSVNDQLANSSVLVVGGSLTGWTDSLGSVHLRSGALNLSTLGAVALNGAGTVLEMSGGVLQVNVQDAEHYTSYEAVDPNAKVKLYGGAIYVDTATLGAQIATGDSLAVVKTDAGNLTVDASQYTIYDDIAGKRFVIDSNDISNGRLNLVLKESQFSDYASSPNEHSVAEYLDVWNDHGVDDPETKEVLTELENEVAKDPAALNQMTGELGLSIFNAQVQSRNLIRQTLTQNVLTPSRAGITVGASALRGQARAYEEEGGLAGWGSAFGASGEADAHKGTSGYDFSMLGGMFGVELGRCETNQFGFYFAYDNLRIDANGALGRAEVDDNQFGLYGKVNDDWGYTFASGSIGVSDYSVKRAISLANIQTQNYKSSSDGWSGSAYLERGFTFTLPGSDLQPYGGLQYTHLKADGYTETGALRPLALKTKDAEYDSLEGVLGVRWLKSTIVGQSQLDLNAYANWTHEFLDSRAEGQTAMVGNPTTGTFRVIGNSTGRDWVYAGLGGTLRPTDSFSVFGGADVQVNEYTTYVNGHAGLKYVW